MGEGLAVRNEDRAQNWFQVIQECRDSGLTNREFCRQRGIPEKKFYYWLRKLRTQASAHAGIGGGTATDCANIAGRCRRGCAPNSFSRRGSAASRNGRSRRSGRGFAFHSNGMIDLSQVRRYYVACGYTDLRRGIDGLAAIVTQQFGAQLNEESLFLFCGRRTDRIKALYWSGDGYLLLYKRLSNGSFQWPRSEAELRLLDPQTFRWLMEGLSMEQRTAIRKEPPKDLF